ncbi:hypothetical protein BT96DRAFT_944935 [Gymnopus androsaceus JB14]|uniref:Uncharacterized protein n=1 Tax=Gymnopus androsaceus JB14 TaxID=1447944 RepID=A0A6A4H2M1_9AGAR|nr:hypothetical protein BT96DRAFT_944935 [Gymnopus androsaceus JB14]
MYFDKISTPPPRPVPPLQPYTTSEEVLCHKALGWFLLSNPRALENIWLPVYEMLLRDLHPIPDGQGRRLVVAGQQYLWEGVVRSVPKQKPRAWAETAPDQSESEESDITVQEDDDVDERSTPDFDEDAEEDHVSKGSDTYSATASEGSVRVVSKHFHYGIPDEIVFTVQLQQMDNPPTPSLSPSLDMETETRARRRYCMYDIAKYTIIFFKKYVNASQFLAIAGSGPFWQYAVIKREDCPWDTPGKPRAREKRRVMDKFIKLFGPNAHFEIGTVRSDEEWEKIRRVYFMKQEGEIGHRGNSVVPEKEAEGSGTLNFDTDYYQMQKWDLLFMKLTTYSFAAEAIVQSPPASIELVNEGSGFGVQDLIPFYRPEGGTQEVYIRMQGENVLRARKAGRLTSARVDGNGGVHEQKQVVGHAQTWVVNGSQEAKISCCIKERVKGDAHKQWWKFLNKS